MMLGGAVEHSMNFHILRFLSYPHPASPLALHAISGADLSVKLAIIRTYAATMRHRGKKVSEICDKIRAGYSRRNEFAHGVISPGPQGKSVLVRSLKPAKNGLMRQPIKYTAKEIRGFNKALHDAALELDDALTELGLPLVGE